MSVWDLSQRCSQILGAAFKVSTSFTAGWHKMTIIYLWGLKGLWINTNDSASTWPAAQPSGFQNSLSILCSVLERKHPTYWGFEP